MVAKYYNTFTEFNKRQFFNPTVNAIPQKTQPATFIENHFCIGECSFTRSMLTTPAVAANPRAVQRHTTSPPP